MKNKKQFKSGESRKRQIEILDESKGFDGIRLSRYEISIRNR